MKKETYMKPACTVLQAELAAIMAASGENYVITGRMDGESGDDNSLKYGGDTQESGHYEVW